MILLLLLAAVEPEVFAVSVGHNFGSPSHPPLRYAELDAQRVADALVDLGRVAKDHVRVVVHAPADTVRKELLSVKARAAAAKAQGRRVTLFYYHSSHGDGVNLELGESRLPFSDLKQLLADTAADVRIGVVDSCHSGQLIAQKGGAPAAAFDMRVHEDMPLAGQVLITSSTDREQAYESKVIGGSFFTHYWLSGLRGPADVSLDGRVTLREAYDYAYKETLAASAATIAGAQHASYDWKLSGSGDLVLSEPGLSAQLVPPAGYTRLVVRDLARQGHVAEMHAPYVHGIALAPGTYEATVIRSDSSATLRVTLAPNERRTLAWSELTLSPIPATTAPKGSGPSITVGAPAPRKGIVNRLSTFGERLLFGDPATQPSK